MSPIPIVFISITAFLNIGSVSFGECCGNTTCSVHNYCVKHPGGYSCQPFSVLGGHCSQDYHPIETLGFENVYALTDYPAV